MYGSSVAWFLASNPDFDGRLLVVERDPSYEYCSTSHTNSCIRQQYSSEINIRCTQFAAQYIKNLRENLGGDERVHDLIIRSFGYMYLADNEAFANTLRNYQKIQKAVGVATRLLTPEQIAAEYPYYFVDDIVIGSHNPVDEGYWDGSAVFGWWRKLAQELGSEYIANEVVAMQKNGAGNRVTGVQLKTGETITCGQIVNASGPRANVTARMAGIEIPVEARKRYSYIFRTERPLSPDLPLTIDPSGVHVRWDGASTFLAGCAPDIDPAVAYDDFDIDHNIWMDKVWPVLAQRVPQFEAIKMTHCWAGHYAYNTFDQNAIVGRHTKVANFIFVNGFSGHGLQLSPALGRGTAELILYGEYRSLDLSPLEYKRIPDGRPFVEGAVI